MSHSAIFYVLEGVFRRWDDFHDRADSYGVETWTIDDFTERVFPGWEPLVSLWRDDVAALLVRDPDGFMMVVPFSWPITLLSDDERSLLDQSSTSVDTHATSLEAQTGVDDDEDEASDRVQCFDAGLTEGVTALTATGLIDALLDETTAYEPGESFLPAPSRSILLGVEAAVLAAPASESEALRTLLALRGVTQPEGVHRLL